MKLQLQSLLGAAVHFPHVHVAPGAKDFNDPNELLLTPMESRPIPLHTVDLVSVPYHYHCQELGGASERQGRTEWVRLETVELEIQ